MSKWNELVSAVRTVPAAAPALRAAMLAQCILESGRGTSRLASEHGNFSGLKWRPEMSGHATKVRYGAHDGADDYCAFVSPEAFVSGYWAFIGRKVYDGWRAYEHDPEGYVGFLASRGYAADPDYARKVTALLPEARALLDDAPGQAEAEPDRPSRNELGETLSDHLDASADPAFVTVPGVVHRWRGRRPGGIEGAIVHYDAGRDRPRGRPDDPEWGARNTLAGAVTSGYAFATVSRSGRIYLPANMDWERWGYHAGESRCPDTGRTGVSQFYVGFEVNSPGYVYPTADANRFVPWFNAVRDQKGNVVLDNRRRATPLNPQDVVYARDQLRHFATPRGNIRPGAYVPFTDDQMQALATVMLWLKRRYPRSFRLERVYGHDEVSPGRKVDPGGSLGAAGGQELTMPQFRAQLLQTWGRTIADD